MPNEQRIGAALADLMNVFGLTITGMSAVTWMSTLKTHGSNR